jgi:hypothetical protein
MEVVEVMAGAQADSPSAGASTPRRGPRPPDRRLSEALGEGRQGAAELSTAPQEGAGEGGAGPRKGKGEEGMKGGRAEGQKGVGK